MSDQPLFIKWDILEDLLDTLLLSYIHIKDNIIVWKRTQLLFICDIDKRINLNIMNIPPRTYRLVMLLCILNDMIYCIIFRKNYIAMII